MIDTNRDGIDIDSCRNVRISNSSINSPNDDAIMLKGTHALGAARVSENITITNCLVSGYEIGSLLDGTYKRTVQARARSRRPHGPHQDRHRIRRRFPQHHHLQRACSIRRAAWRSKASTASHIEDVSVSNITMRDVSNAPIFIRLGSRMRAPEGTAIGSIQRISISNVVAYNADPRYGSIISGIPGHDVEDVTLSGIRILYRGGLTLDQVAKQPADLVNTFFFRGTGGVPPREPYDTPEREKEYPEPSMFGMMPAYGFFIRHAKGIELNDVDVSYMQEDRRPAFVLDSAERITLENCKPQKAQGAPGLVMMKSKSITVHNCEGLADFKGDSVASKEM